MRVLVLLTILFVLPLAAYAQKQKLKRKGHKKDTAQVIRHHRPIIPHHASLQFAGSMGMFSAGFGYASSTDRNHLDINLGYVPSFYSSDDLYVITLKVTHAFWKTRMINENMGFTPFTSGIFITYTLGKNFSWPARYPDGYYWWSESVRPNIFVGGNVQYIIPNSIKVRKVTLYYELGTNELKVVSYIKNASTLPFRQILQLGIGVKTTF